MTTYRVSALDFPALDGRVVTEAHAAICERNGHAVHKANGLDSGICPRCGEVKLDLLPEPEVDDSYPGEWSDDYVAYPRLSV